MNTIIDSKREGLDLGKLQDFNLGTPISKLEPTQSTSDFELFANQVYTQLCNQFSHLDSLKVFQMLRTMLKEKNNCASQELDYEITTKKQLFDNFTTFKF